MSIDRFRMTTLFRDKVFGIAASLISNNDSGDRRSKKTQTTHTKTGDKRIPGRRKKKAKKRQETRVRKADTQTGPRDRQDNTDRHNTQRETRSSPASQPSQQIRSPPK